jgi:hypothetical protein
MKIPERGTVEALRREYPAGRRVTLLEMDDPQAPPKGTEGTVMCVDDTGTVHVRWDTGSSLGAVYGIDRIRTADR